MTEKNAPMPSVNINQVVVDINEPLRRYSVVHKSWYDFSFLKSMEEPMLSQVVETLFINISKYKKPRDCSPHPRFLRVRDFFQWVFSQSKESSVPHMENVGQSLRNGICPTSEDWQSVVNDFRSIATAPPKENPFTNGESDLTKSIMFDHVRGGLEALADGGILPHITLRGIPKARERSRGIKSLGEISRSILDQKKIEELLNCVFNKSHGGTEIDKLQAADFFKSLAAEGIAVANNDEDQIQQLLDLVSNRLAMLRKCAEDDLLLEWEIFQEGQRLLDGCESSYERDMHELVEDFVREQAAGTLRENYPNPHGHPFNSFMVGAEYRWKRMKITPDHPVFKERLSKLLTFIENRYCGLYPCTNVKSSDPWENAMFIHRHAHTYFGGSTVVQPYIEPSPYALFCGQLILLIDTGFNITVIQELTVDCVSETDNSEKVLITGVKDRAKGEEQRALVDIIDGNKISAPTVIKIIEEMTTRFRKVASGESQSRWRNPIMPSARNDLHRFLFICRQEPTKQEKRQLILGLTPAMLMGATKKMRERHECLANFKFTPENIRPSVAIKKYFEGGLDAEAARIHLGQKNKSCVPKYVSRTASRMALHKMIRIFMNRFEAIMIRDIPGAAEKLGFTPEEYERLLADAERTGLGTVCDAFRKHEGKVISVKKENCNPEIDCLDCHLMKIIPASKENIVDLIVHHEYLESNRERLENENPERWNEVYARWWALTKAAIEKIKVDTSVSRKIFKEALAEAQSMDIESFPPII